MPKNRTRARLSKRRVEDSLLTMLGDAKAEIDTDFSQADVRFKTPELYERGRKFRTFKSGGIQFNQAGCDRENLTISFIFHKV